MNLPSMPPASTPVAEDSSAELFDYPVIRDWVLFIAGSVNRHRRLAAACLGFVFLTSIAAAAVLPRKYEAATKLLTHQTGFMASLSNPYRGAQDEGPTRAARERVLARDNLEKIISQVNLIEEWQRTRNPVLGLKDKAIQKVFGEWTNEDWTEIMVGMLEKRITVVTDDGTVEIRVAWPEPNMARRIVETAQQNFLETRHVSEVAAISETIGILEIHASQTQTSIDEALANLQKVIDTRGGKAPKAAPAPSPTAAPKPAAPKTPEAAAAPASGQDLTQLRFLLRSKQRSITDLEDFRTRQMTDLKANLDQQLVTYGPAHPVVMELKQRIEGLQRDSPQLLTLKRDEAELIKEIEAKGGGKEERAANDTSMLQVRRTASAMETSLANLAPDLDRDPNVTVAQDQLRVALARYQELLMRVEAARLELDTARAAFKFRFSVVNPPQTPRKPTSPNVPLILIAGLIGGILLAFVASSGLDLWNRTVCEPWQVERQLKLPLLALITGMEDEQSDEDALRGRRRAPNKGSARDVA